MDLTLRLSRSRTGRQRVVLIWFHGITIDRQTAQSLTGRCGGIKSDLHIRGWPSEPTAVQPIGIKRKDVFKFALPIVNELLSFDDARF